MTYTFYVWYTCCMVGNNGHPAVESKQINLRLPDDLWLAAKIKAAQNRMGLSEAIRLLIAEWVAPVDG